MHECKTLVDELLRERFALSDAQCEAFVTYYDMLIDWNSRVNLTAITEPRAVVEKHFLDSLLILEDIDLRDGASLIDVGTGAGFPGIALAIARPKLQVDLLDSLGKRVRFLESVADKLHLDNVDAYHDRAEIFAADTLRRESYDYVTARAVARLPLLSEYCLPFAKVGGTFIAMKGPDGAEELAESANALKTLGAVHKSTAHHHLPEGEVRDILLIEKTKPTPKRYPRRPGDAKRKPIV